jgi:hypothetical protein
MKRQKMILVFFISLVLIVSISLAACGGIHVPVGVRHFFHLVAPPEDLYKPIVVDVFPFWERGFSKSYSLNPKYMDFYELGLLAVSGGFPSREKFDGKIKVEFFHEGKIVSEHEITSIQGGVYAGKDMTQYKKVSLMDFEIPLQGNYKKNISIRLTVLDADRNLAKYGDSLQMYIAVSSSP